MDNAVQRSPYPLDNAVGFPYTYLLERAIKALNNWGLYIRVIREKLVSGAWKSNYIYKWTALAGLFSHFQRYWKKLLRQKLTDSCHCPGSNNPCGNDVQSWGSFDSWHWLGSDTGILNLADIYSHRTVKYVGVKKTSNNPSAVAFFPQILEGRVKIGKHPWKCKKMLKWTYF